MADDAAGAGAGVGAGAGAGTGAGAEAVVARPCSVTVRGDTVPMKFTVQEALRVPAARGAN
jgi:hypothetical protein